MNNHLIFAQGAIAMLGSEDHIKHYVATLNINPTQLAQVVGDMIWMPSEREQVASALDKLVYGMAETTGFARESITAEWVAMMIVTLVKPLNWHVACTMFSNTSYSADVIKYSDINARAIEKNVTHRKLFALCTMFICNTDRKVFDDFQKSIKSKLEGKTK